MTTEDGVYDYEKEKTLLMINVDGIRDAIDTLDRARSLTHQAGVFTLRALQSIMHLTGGDNFREQAVIDLLVEIGELEYVSKGGDSRFWILRATHPEGVTA